MAKRKRLSYKEKLKICKLYEEGKASYRSITKDFGVSQGTFELIYFKYSNFGSSALKLSKRDAGYTKDFKEKIIREYKSGNFSYKTLAIKYKIHNPSIISAWVLGYNSTKTTYSGGSGVTIMSRKTSFDERVKIVKYLIDNNNNYNKTSEHFKVSYKQVYSWHQKYKKLGINGLIDKRGIKKDEEELSELELLKRENSRLKKELELSRAAEKVLKKKRELEGKTLSQELEMKNRMKR